MRIVLSALLVLASCSGSSDGSPAMGRLLFASIEAVTNHGSPVDGHILYRDKDRVIMKDGPDGLEALAPIRHQRA